MGAQKQHGRRKDHHVIKAETLYGTAGEDHITVDVFFLHRLQAIVVVGNAPANALILESEITAETIGRPARPDRLILQSLGANNGIFNVFNNLVPGCGLGVMGIDIDDQIIFESVGIGLPFGVGQNIAGIGLNIDRFDRIFRNFLHPCPPLLPRAVWAG